MATVNLDNVQFWDPLLNPFLHKQRTVSSQSMSKSTYTSSSRNQPAPLHNKAARIFKRNGQSTFVIAAAQHQGDDSTARAQGRNNDPTNRDDEIDDELLSIEKLRDQISRKGISTGGCRNPKDTLQHLEEPTLDISGSRLSLTQSRLDSIGGSQGTRDQPVILEDDELDTPNPEATAEPSKPTDPFSHGPWYDIEDGGYVDDDLCPFPPLEQEGLNSTPTPAQDEPHSCHHSPRPSEDQINQLDDRTRPSASEEPTPHSLPTSLDKNGGGESEEENVSELEKDLLLAFEQDKSLQASAPAPSSPRLCRHSVESSHRKINQEYDQSGAGNVRSEELTRGSPLGSQDRGEELQEQQQRQEVAEAMREDDDDKEPEQRGEKRQHQGANKEISSDIHHSEDIDRSHETNKKDDEDPRPAKRRKLALIPTYQALTPPNKHGPAPLLGRPHSLTPSSTTQPEIDESPSQADHAHPPTLVNNDHHNTPQTSRSPSAIVESIPVAEYREWPFHGFVKCTTISDQIIYNLEFALPRTSKHFHLSLHSDILGSVSRESPAKAAVSQRAISTRKPGKELTKEQESLLVKMVREDETWTKIARHFPGHRLQSLKENFFTKQGGQPRKRGRKSSARAGSA